MKKTINRTLRIQAAAGIILCALAIKILGAQNDFVVISCVSDAVAAKLQNWLDSMQQVNTDLEWRT